MTYYFCMWWAFGTALAVGVVLADDMRGDGYWRADAFSTGIACLAAGVLWPVIIYRIFMGKRRR
jgi:hypothetical protein